MATDESSAGSKSKMTKVLGHFRPKPSIKGRQVHIFGAPLEECMSYAGCTTLLVRKGREMAVDVPVIVAECGKYLKREGVHVEGIFRVSGSFDRIHRLQETFDQSPSYGRGVDWNGFTAFDAADVLRRYLRQLPEPVIPPSAVYYQRFLAPLRERLERTSAGEAADDPGVAIDAYRSLIQELPRANRCLLVYLLDLLALFAANSADTRMGAGSLATVFQPELLCPSYSDADRGLVPVSELRTCQAVLEFLVGYGDSFEVSDSFGDDDDANKRNQQGLEISL